MPSRPHACRQPPPGGCRGREPAAACDAVGCLAGFSARGGGDEGAPLLILLRFSLPLLRPPSSV
eukprot:8612083-Pyramimonas_sp.AAC.1